MKNKKGWLTKIDLGLENEKQDWRKAWLGMVYVYLGCNRILDHPGLHQRLLWSLLLLRQQDSRQLIALLDAENSYKA